MTEKQKRIRMTTKVLRDVLAAERFESGSDLKEALKCRLARLRIPYDVDTVEPACDLVDISNRRRR